MLTGVQAEKQSRELSAEIEALRVKCQELKQEIEQTTTESDRLWNQASVFEQIVGTLKGKRIEAQAKKESIDDLGKYIEIIDKSDEWLATELEKYEERMSRLSSHIDTQVECHERLRREIDQCRQQLGSKMTEAGKHQAEKAQYERQIARRETMIKEAASRHGMRGFDMELDDSLIQDFMARLGKMSRDQNLNLERVKQETRDGLQRAQDALTQLGERRSALQQSKDHAIQEITSNDKKAGGLQAELNTIEVDEGGKVALESAVDDVHAKLTKAKTDFDTATWDEKLRSVNERLRVVEAQSDQLNAELIQSTRQAGEVARLEFLQKELKDRQRSLDTMCEAYDDRLAEAVGPQWRPLTLEREFQSVLDQANDRVAEAQRHRDGVSRQLEQVEFSLRSNREGLKRKSKELQECRSRIREAIGTEPDDYPEFVAAAERDRDTRKGDVDNFDNLRKYYEEGLRIARENSACRLCTRKFKDQQEYSKFLAKLETLISGAGRQSLRDELRALEAELKKAREAGPSFDMFQRLSKTEIPSLTLEVQKLEDQRAALLTQVEEQDARVKQRQDGKKDFEALIKTVQTINKYNIEIERLEDQVKELSVAKEDVGLSRTLEVIQEELTLTAEEARSVKNATAKLIADKERGRNQVTVLELELRDLKSKLTDALHQLEKKGTIVARIEEFRAMNQAQRMTIERTEQEIQKLAPQFARARAEYDDVRNRGAAREKDLLQEASRLSDSVHQLQVADQDINAYLDRGGPNQLARNQREVDQIKQEIGRLEAEQHGVTVEINKAQKQRDHHDETKRTISDNLRHRRDIRALEIVNAEIAELEAKNAEVDRDRFVKEANRMGVKHRKLSAEEATKMGAMKSKDDQLMKLLDDWNTDYRNAAQNFKEAHIKVEVHP